MVCAGENGAAATSSPVPGTIGPASSARAASPGQGLLLPDQLDMPDEDKSSCGIQYRADPVASQRTVSCISTQPKNSWRAGAHHRRLRPLGPWISNVRMY